MKFAKSDIFTKSDVNKTLRVKKDYLDKNRKRYKIDANGQTLWRIATVIANKLTGKNKIEYNDFWDAGDFVLVENVDKIKVTGHKMDQKMYYRYSWYKGNLKEMTLSEMLSKKPEKVIELAVRWMLPKNKLRASRMKRLKAVVGTTSKYDHFKPTVISND
jgi:large subunit ribosomal protein L13